MDIGQVTARFSIPKAVLHFMNFYKILFQTQVLTNLLAIAAVVILARLQSDYQYGAQSRLWINIISQIEME